MGKPTTYYAVARGRQPGIYTAWYGPEGAEERIRGFAGARYRKFATLSEARRWLENPAGTADHARQKDFPADPPASLSPEKIVVYTDGGCRGNPGPGGYGVIMITSGSRVELAGGFRMTTNNRMELMASLAALRTLHPPADVILYTDSRYVVNGINKGWARKWRANNWMRTGSEAAQNSDLWAELLDLCDAHRVQFAWVPGHAGQAENERCDRLATAAAAGPGLKEDTAYVEGRTHLPRSQESRSHEP
ncbi:MAG: ribonuclease HI [Thermodesulfobacteriota bacterium]